MSSDARATTPQGTFDLQDTDDLRDTLQSGERAGVRRSRRPGAERPLVVCIGIATVDLVAGLDAPLQPRMKQRVGGIVSLPGGSAANAAAAIAGIGVRARLVASVGEDERAHMIRGWLHAAQVEDRLLTRAGVDSAISMVAIDPDGERTIVNATAPELVGLPDAADRAHITTAMDGAAAVCADVRWPAGAQVGLEFAAAAGIPGVLDLDRTLPGERAQVLRLARTASHVFASEPGLRDLVGDVEVDAGLTALAALVAAPEVRPARPGPTVVGVTRGAEDVRWRLAGRGVDPVVTASPVPAVIAVDTLGAGDVWHGVCAAALATGAPTERAIATASVAAALRCARRGGWEILPTADEVAACMSGPDAGR